MRDLASWNSEVSYIAFVKSVSRCVLCESVRRKGFLIIATRHVSIV
jgi:hypothetical protein